VTEWLKISALIKYSIDISLEKATAYKPYKMEIILLRELSFPELELAKTIWAQFSVLM